MSNNLNASRVVEGQTGKETTINDGLGALDAALTEIATIDASADATVTATALLKAATFILAGATAAHTLTLAPIKRAARFANTGSAAVTLKMVATSIAIPSGKALSLVFDGTADGMAPASNIVPAGGSAGQALVKSSGTDYDAAWATVAAGGGGGGGGIAGALYELGALATVDPAYFPKTALATGVVLQAAIVAGQGTRFKFKAATPSDGSGYNVALRDLKASTPLDVRVRFSAYVHPAGSTYPARGLFLTDGTKYIGFQTGRNGTTDGFVLQIQRRTTRTAYDSNVVNYTGISSIEWFRIYDDGTTRHFMCSPDGQDWDTIYQESSTAFLTPTAFGVGVTMEGSAATTGPALTQYAFLTSYADNQA